MKTHYTEEAIETTTGKRVFIVKPTLLGRLFCREFLVFE